MLSNSSQTTCFQSASKKVLAYLHNRLGFGLWMVTRTDEEDWIVFAAEDHGYSVKRGDVFRWADSFCSRMVQGQGPRVAPRSGDVPIYATAPITDQLEIGAYVGVPLYRGDGNLFGTLCGIDPQPQPEEIVHELPQIELMARLLESVLESESKAGEEARRAERAEAQTMTDSLTGLFNRRGWEELLEAEEIRCRRYSHPAAIVSLDLDNLKQTNDEGGHCSGDRLLQQTARILLDQVRKTDIVARVGGDEFLILAIECHEQPAVKLVDRLKDTLEAEAIAASIGIGIHRPEGTLRDACYAANQAMHEGKRQRKQANSLASSR